MKTSTQRLILSIVIHRISKKHIPFVGPSITLHNGLMFGTYGFTFMLRILLRDYNLRKQLSE